jgi:phage/plasmid-like protein (TIGR03299 family)
MAHEIEMIDGKAQLCYVGEVPWHGLGTRVDPGMKPEDMMREAGLDWEVEKREIYFKDNDGNLVKCPKKRALIRGMDEMFLDVVTKDWNEFQNLTVFRFFNKYAEAGGIDMETVGSLKKGKIIWGLAKVNDSFDLFGGKDQVDSYLLLSNPHHYGRGVDIRFTPIRVVCNNTLSMSLSGEASLGISLNHRSEFDEEKVHAALNEAHEKLHTYKEMAEFLANRRYSQDTVFEYFNRVFPKTSNVISFNEMMERFKKGEMDVTSRNAREAMEVLNTQPGAEYGEGSFWQAYNAVTYMTNHRVGHNPDTRLQSVWFGQNKNRNIDALGVALEMAEKAPRMKVAA